MIELAAQPKRGIGPLIWLIVLQLMALGSLSTWVVMAGLPVISVGSGSSPGFLASILASWA